MKDSQEKKMDASSKEELTFQKSMMSSKSPLNNSKNSSESNTRHSSRSTLNTRYSSRSTYTLVSEIASEKGLVCVQVVILARLCFDFGSAIIGFLKHRKSDDECCGYELDPFSAYELLEGSGLGLGIGQIVAVLDMLLILVELLFLLRSVWSTMAKNKSAEETSSDEENELVQEKPKKSCCARCLSYNGKTLLSVVNKVSLINPFFACFIAFMLLYQSDRTESLVVLGLEFGSIVLHFVTVGLTETIRSWAHFLLHCIVLIPFLAMVAMQLIYMKQGGVCYIVEQGVFHFQGCELCPDGIPPINGNCKDANGIEYQYTPNLLDVGNWDLDSLSLKSKFSDQEGRFCGSFIQEVDGDWWDNGRWEKTNFCFFPYT